ncbi:MAG: PCRF domain-containing protein, partial [Thermoleophilia bacterium]|nr:PCRF domain-containing protein [Thermoleophilia bacterium]
MIERLVGEIEEKYQALTRELSDPTIFDDPIRYAEVSKAHADLSEPHRMAAEYLTAQAAEADAALMLEEAGLDAEMRDFLSEERTTAREAMERLSEALRAATVEKDPRDEKSAFVEVRSAAGGDEAALFAFEVSRMLMKYAERLRYKVEVLNTNESPLGGLKEIIFEVKGRGAYGVFKYESGVHRVQ